MCQARYLPDQILKARYSKTAPHPKRVPSVIIIWRWQTIPICTTVRRKLESRHTKRARKQVPDTLRRQRDGQEGRIPRDFHLRNGLIWSSPKGRTGEAAAMRPKSLRHRPTDTCQPSLKRAEHNECSLPEQGPDGSASRLSTDRPLKKLSAGLE